MSDQNSSLSTQSKQKAPIPLPRQSHSGCIRRDEDAERNAQRMQFNVLNSGKSDQGSTQPESSDATVHNTQGTNGNNGPPEKPPRSFKCSLASIAEEDLPSDSDISEDTKSRESNYTQDQEQISILESGPDSGHGSDKISDAEPLNYATSNILSSGQNQGSSSDSKTSAQDQRQTSTLESSGMGTSICSGKPLTQFSMTRDVQDMYCEYRIQDQNTYATVGHRRRCDNVYSLSGISLYNGEHHTQGENGYATIDLTGRKRANVHGCDDIPLNTNMTSGVQYMRSADCINPPPLPKTPLPPTTFTPFMELTNRFKSKIGHVIQKKRIVIGLSALVSAYASIGIIYIHDRNIIHFYNVIIPAIVLGLFLALVVSCYGIKQFVHTEEYTRKNDQSGCGVERVGDILSGICNPHSSIKDTFIKSMILKYDNGTILELSLNNIECNERNVLDFEALNRVNVVSTVGSVINNRSIYILAPLTSVIITNAAVSGLLYALHIHSVANNIESGIKYFDYVKDFYSNSNTGFVLLTFSCFTAVMMTYFSVYYYSKTGCDTMVISNDIAHKKYNMFSKEAYINRKYVEVVITKIIDILCQCNDHGEALSLALDQVVVEGCNGQTVICNLQQ